MKTYFIHLKGSNTPTEVRGSKIEVRANFLTIRDADGEAVGAFYLPEIQGWHMQAPRPEVALPDRIVKPIKTKRA